MYCIKCGNEISENAVFCTKCGNRVAATSAPVMQPATAQVTEENKTVRRKRKRWPFVVLFSTLIVIILAVLIVLYVRSNSPQHRLQEQLDLGYRYLSELNYEKAVAAFEAAIEIDPKNVEAYLGLVDAYTGTGDSEGIIHTYKLAAENLGKNELKDIREAASDSIAEIIDDLISDGDYDSAKKLVYDLADIDPKRSEHILIHVIDYQNNDVNDPDDGDGGDDKVSDEGLELINSENYDEAISYYDELITDDPTNADPYIARAVIWLAMDDSISALRLLEDGIAAGADRGTLSLAEAYIRDNTIPVSSTGTVLEWDSDSTGTYYYDGWVNITFDEYGNKLKYEKHVGDISSYCIEYDLNGNAVYEDDESSYDRQTYWRTFNDAGELIYSRYDFYNSIFERVETTETYYSYKYDAMGRVVERYEDADTEFWKGTTYYEYDAAGNLINEKTINVNGDMLNYWSYQYDDRGNMIEDSGGPGGSRYTYDLMDMVLHIDWDAGVGGHHATTDYVNVYHFIGDIESYINTFYHA